MFIGRRNLFFALWGLPIAGVHWLAAQEITHEKRLSLNGAVILVDPREPSYVLYGAKDLSGYLTEITGTPVPVATLADKSRGAGPVIAIGETMSRAAGADIPPDRGLGDEGFVLRSFEKAGSTVIAIAGRKPGGTNAGIATFMRKVRREGTSAYVEHALDLRSMPAIAVRGIHLNGWPLRYPYAFRAWKEQDWKRFVDIAWLQRVNLFYLWPFMEIMPVPLSSEDQAYLEEVRRVVDYARSQRGMEVWIMQSANRVGVSDCGTRDPRFRTYWVNECQKDMNPADPAQFDRIMKSFEALYRVVNNPEGFSMIDSDPGGWPQSPLSDQMKIFHGARKLLDRYSIHGARAKLVNWMWLGWGRHKFFTSTDAVVAAYDWTDKNPDESDARFMARTIRNFRDHLAEPWELIAGMPAYLAPTRDESALKKTIYLPYGAIESEPAFPATNLGLEPVRKVFDTAAEYPELRGVMGNNQLMLLQFPRTFYFYETAWEHGYRNEPEEKVLHELARQLYPEQENVIAESFLALRERNAEKIGATLGRLEALVQKGDAGRPGALGRYLFPDSLSVARNLLLQVRIRLSRQLFLKTLRATPEISECARLLEDYFDKLLAWNKESGWDKMIDITIWTAPIYQSDKEFTEGMSALKKVLGQGRPYTSYSQTAAFFNGIRDNLLRKYDENSVMIGCVEPLRLAVLQSQ